LHLLCICCAIAEHCWHGTAQDNEGITQAARCTRLAAASCQQQPRWLPCFSPKLVTRPAAACWHEKLSRAVSGFAVHKKTAHAPPTVSPLPVLSLLSNLLTPRRCGSVLSNLPVLVSLRLNHSMRTSALRSYTPPLLAPPARLVRRCS
jgi:hypothetical protein